MTGSGQCQRVDVEHDIEVEDTVHVGNKTYRLRSVVYHTGTADFGHYFCVCRYSNDGNQWWFYNNTTRMEVCSLATAKTKASISALVRAYLCIYESSEGNDFAAESGSHGGIGAEKQNAEQGPRPSAGTSSGENTSKPQREAKSAKCGHQRDSQANTQADDSVQPTDKKAKCSQCAKEKIQTAFSKKQLKAGAGKVCEECVEENKVKKKATQWHCAECKQDKAPQDFSGKQHTKGNQKRCKQCCKQV